MHQWHLGELCNHLRDFFLCVLIYLHTWRCVLVVLRLKSALCVIQVCALTCLFWLCQKAILKHLVLLGHSLMGYCYCAYLLDQMCSFAFLHS